MDEGPALDHERLTTALLTIVEREGLGAINMRRVAADLGVSPRLIYHHVRDKETMLVNLFDEILARHMPALDGLGWEAVLREIAATARRAYARYPGVAAAVLARSVNAVIQPHAKIIREAVLAALADAGLDHDQVETAYVQFSVFILGSLVLRENIDRGDEQLALTRGRIERSLEMGLDMFLAGIRHIAKVSRA